MRIYTSIVVVLGTLLISNSRLTAEENPAERQAMDALQKLGATCDVDASLPGHPVVAVDLSQSDVHGGTLKLLKAFPRLHTVKWRGGWLLGLEDMQQLGKLTQLRHLDIWAYRATDEWLRCLEGFADLESLGLVDGAGFTDQGLQHLQRLSKLRSLNLDNCTNITNKGLAHLRGLTNLRFLNLCCTKTNDDGLVSLKDLSNLQTLILSNTKISDGGLAHLEGLSTLQCLDLESTRITDKGLVHLKRLIDLRSLNIDAQGITGDGLEHLKGLPQLRTLRLCSNIQGENLPLLKGLIHLRELAFRSIRFEDKYWKYLGELTSLQSLEVDYSRFATDEGLEHLGRLTRLRTLKLGNMKHMTDRSLEHLTDLTNLQELRLSQLDNISGTGLQQLKVLTDLQSLELYSLPVTEDDLEFITAFRKLRTLGIYNRMITDESLKRLQGLPNLRELRVSYTCISDAGLVYLSQSTNLHTLEIAATSITNRGLGHLKALRNLKKVYVEDTNVTDAGVESFRQARPGTKVIQYSAKSTSHSPGPERLQTPVPSLRLLPLVRILAESNDECLRLDVLRGMHDALQGRRNVTAPEGWSEIYRKLSDSKNAEIREKVLQLSVLFGDPQALAALRKTAADSKADAASRRIALQTLIEKRPPDLLPLLRQLITDRALRGLALRGLASYSDPATPALILEHYSSFTDSEKADAVATLASRPEYALALLDAMEQGRVPRRDLSAFTVRQLLSFNDKKLTERLTRIWGTIRPPSQEKTAALAKYKAMVPAAALKKANREHGRALFVRNCATCHTLFGEGAKIGPDLTGSQRANPEYLLIKLLDPSAVVAKDYQMTIITTTAGRILSGLVKEESDKALTLQTQNEVVRLPKFDIEERRRSEQSMMPDGLLAPLSAAEVRDLIAYVSGPGQVPLPSTAQSPRE